MQSSEVRSRSEFKKRKRIQTPQIKLKKSASMLPSLTKAHSEQLTPNKKAMDVKRQAITHKFDERSGVTILNIRFGISSFNHGNDDEQQNFINSDLSNVAINKLTKQETTLLPYLKSRNNTNPQEYLKNIGYDPCTKISSELYADKIQQRKNKYINKIELLKRRLCDFDKNTKMAIMQKSRIKNIILSQQIKRKRQRQILLEQQKKGHLMLQQLLHPSSQIKTV